MENPVSIIKSNLSVGKVIGFLVVGIVVFAVLDALNVTDWVLYPYRNVKAKFFTKGG